ncbi:MAG: tyrosine-type recombinase/integrase [Bacilli bacterium]|nr:tyrosine-type recombinase/integrase [Bacilli bacterium]
MMTTDYSPFFKNEIESFIQDLDRSPITKQSYRTILIKFSEYLKGRYLETPKSRNIIEYKEYLSKTLAPVSIQKAIVVLRGFFHYLARNEIYPDISVGINSMKTTRVMRRDVLNVNDVSLLINIAKAKSYDSLEAYRNYAILSLIATTGLRTIEVERAEIDDLSFINDTHILYVRGKGRDDKSEYVKLSDEVYDIIETYLAHRRDDYSPLFITHGNNSYGNPIRTRSIREIIKNFLFEAGLEDRNMTAHSLRHFVCSEILRSGGSLEEAQQVLRHRDISTTQIYNHSLKREENDSELIISSKLFIK